VAASNVAGTNGGLFTVATNGTVTFDANGDFENLAVGETATTSYTYTLTDGEGGTDTATITVEVTGANDRPVIVDPVTGNPIPGVIDPTTGLPTDPVTGLPLEPIPAQTGNDADGPISIDVGALVADPDTSDVLDFDATGLPPGLSIDPLTGEITGTIDPSASQGGPANDGVYPVTVTATDPHGAAVTLTFTYTVSNPAPIAVDNTYTGAGEDSGPTVIGNALTDNDGGVDSDPDGDSLALVAASNVAGTNGGLFTVATNGTVTFDANGDFENLAVGETAARATPTP
jgi:VCBS repeat-containing protein